MEKKEVGETDVERLRARSAPLPVMAEWPIRFKE